MKITAVLFVVSALSVCRVSVDAAKTTRSSRHQLSEDQIVDLIDLIDATINDRLADKSQCPIDQYWYGATCEDCADVCGNQIDALCLQMCPAYVLKLIKQEKPLVDESFDVSLILSICAFAMAGVCLFAFIAYVVHQRSSTNEQGKFSQFTSVESSFMDMTPNQQHSNAQTEPLLTPAPSGPPHMAGSREPPTPVNVIEAEVRPPTPVNVIEAEVRRPTQVSPSIPDAAANRPVSTHSSSRSDPLQQVQPESDAESMSNFRP